MSYEHLVYRRCSSETTDGRHIFSIQCSAKRRAVKQGSIQVGLRGGMWYYA